MNEHSEFSLCLMKKKHETNSALVQPVIPSLITYSRAPARSRRGSGFFSSLRGSTALGTTASSVPRDSHEGAQAGDRAYDTASGSDRQRWRVWPPRQGRAETSSEFGVLGRPSAVWNGICLYPGGREEEKTTIGTGTPSTGGVTVLATKAMVGRSRSSSHGIRNYPSHRPTSPSTRDSG